MTVKDLIKELKKQDQESEVLLQISYTDHCCGPDSYCYCSPDEYNFTCYSVASEKPPKKLPKNYKRDERVFIRGDV